MGEVREWDAGDTRVRVGLRARYRLNLHALAGAQKPRRGTPAYSRWVNRPLARRVAAAADLVGMSPNGATVLSASLTAAGLVILASASPSVGVGVAVSLLLAAGYVMDSVDGQLARLHERSSVAGEWLDHTVDCAKTVTFHLAVLIAWFRYPPVEGDLALLVPIGFAVADVLCFFGLIVMPLLRTGQQSGQQAAVRREHPLRTWVLLPTDYGIFCWVFVLVGFPTLFFAGYTLLFAINAAVLVLVLRKWWGELTALDRTAGRAGAAVPAPTHMEG